LTLSTSPQGETKELWSGLNKGPPRKEKFPEADVVISAIKAAMKK
jgi:hypothetical protein